MGIGIKYYVETVAQDRTMIYNFDKHTWQLKRDKLIEACMTTSYDKALQVYSLRSIVSDNVSIGGIAFSKD